MRLFNDFNHGGHGKAISWTGDTVDGGLNAGGAFLPLAGDINEMRFVVRLTFQGRCFRLMLLHGGSARNF